jgi:hypothetical protein
VKHPAWAAAINSSGLVPLAFSKRVENEYGVFDSTPLSLDIVPLPSFSEPFHTAEALRIMSCFLLLYADYQAGTFPSEIVSFKGFIRCPAILLN